MFSYRDSRLPDRQSGDAFSIGVCVFEPVQSMALRTRLSAHFFLIPLCFQDVLFFVNIVQFAGKKIPTAQ